MEFRKMTDKKDQQVEFCCVPTTPLKPILQKTVPIYSPGQENPPQKPTHSDGAVACSKFTGFMEKNKISCIGSVTEGRMKNIVGENSEICVETVSGNAPTFGHMSFSQLMLMQENAASANLNATPSEPMNPFFSSLDSQMKYNREVNNIGDTQGTSFIGYSQIASVSVNMEKNNLKDNYPDLDKTPQPNQRRRKHRPKVIVESKPRRTQKNVQPEATSTGKRKYVRRKGVNQTPTTPAEETTDLLTPESTKRSCRRTLFDGFADTENAIAQPGKSSEIEDNINVSLPCDIGTSMKETSKSLPEETQAPKPSRRRATPKEGQSVKRKYIRKKPSNKECTPTAEGTTNLTQEIKLQPAKIQSQSSTSYDKESNPPEGQQIEKTNKRGRKKKTPNKSYPTEATAGFNEPLMLGPNTRSRSGKKSRGASSTGGENSNACIGQGSGMMNILYSHDTSKQQELKDFHISLLVDTQVQNTSLKDNFIDTELKQKQTKRRYTRRTATNKVSSSHILSNEDTKASVATSHETKSIVSCNFEDDKNKKDSQATTLPRNEQNASMLKAVAQSFPNDPVPQMVGMNTIGVHHNDLSLYRKKSEIESTSNFAISAATNVREVETPQYAHWLPYTSSSNSLIVSSESEFISMLRRREGSTSQVGNCSCLAGIQSHYEKQNFTGKQNISDKQISEGALLTYNDSSATKSCESKKKQNRRKSTLSKTTDSSSNVIQHHSCALGNYQLSSDKSLDISDVDVIVEQFRNLKINIQENALVRYKQKKQKQKQKRAIPGDGTIIPFEGVKKQYPRPRVDLDEETNRVWKLLMLDINSPGIDGEDEAKAKWWKEERNVFRGRADSFIAKMHLVQGDRRFSRWKGSVVDSVVGVFLTQNVSDHLSSSAFMALAARFPQPTSTSSNNMEGTSLVEEITERDATLNQSVHDRRTELNKIVSSQCSVISGDASNEQSHEKMGSGSDSTAEAEDLPSTSTDKHLQMASSTKSQEADVQRITSEKLTAACSIPTEKDAQVSLKAATFPSQDLLSSELPNATCCQGTDPENQAEMSHSERIGAPVNDGQSDAGAQKHEAQNETPEIRSKDNKGKGKEQKEEFNWDSLRTDAQAKSGKREKTENTMDSLDWDAVRRAAVSVISEVIKERGMNNRLAERIKDFLNRLVEEHGAIDLEWLRDVPPNKAKEFLLSIRGLGLKSVECVRLLTLHHLAFPVDTNVGRIAVRLGWVPLQPLPESLHLHLLELYPILESIQKYLWPRLCKLDQRTLYELHYQMITFGKVFCTKNRPNCNACPMKGECRHFASAFASARLALPGPEQKDIVSTSGNNATDQNPTVSMAQRHLPLLENANQGAEILQTEVAKQPESISGRNICHPIIEEPKTPEPECSQVPIHDIEDAFWDNSSKIPSIDLNMQEFSLNLQNYMEGKMELQQAEMSKALVALTPEAANIPMPKLKNVGRLRTEHSVYELPDTHPLLDGWDTREIDDPGKYLLAIWTPGETADSVQPPERKCSYQGSGQLCNEKECLTCNSVRESDSQTVRGTILIPCRTAMQGSFPLNGTYFQVNEVFADHESSVNPISVPRSWIWNLKRRTVYFGTSVSSIFKGMRTPEIQLCFWRGYVCVRGFERATRAPRPLLARLHFPPSKTAKATGTRRRKSTGPKSEGAKTNPEQPEQPELVSGSQNLQEGVKPKENHP